MEIKLSGRVNTEITDSPIYDKVAIGLKVIIGRVKLSLRTSMKMLVSYRVKYI